MSCCCSDVSSASSDLSTASSDVLFHVGPMGSENLLRVKPYAESPNQAFDSLNLGLAFTQALPPVKRVIIRSMRCCLGLIFLLVLVNFYLIYQVQRHLSIKAREALI